jgi:CubicO group peptidase (beta-lactamase class C family)
MLRSAQVSERIPGLQAAIHRADRAPWTFEVGDAGTGRPLDAATQFRIGSVTKTFIGTLVMQCRDEGLLDLDDAIGRHVKLHDFADFPIRRLLSHTSGMQVWPDGDWDTLRTDDTAQLLAELDHAEFELPPGRRYRYSSTAMSLLAGMVATLRGCTWDEAMAEWVFRPLGLASITVDPGPTAANGYLVDAYSDHARAEPPYHMGRVHPAAGLWGSAADLAKWAGFLADPAAVDPEARVLSPGTVEEMRWPHTPTDADQWHAAFGLSLIIMPQGSRIVHVGHGGSARGFQAGVYGRRGGGAPRGLGVAVLGNAGNAVATLDLPHALLRAVVEVDPAEIEPWRIGEPPPERYRSALGLWWLEGQPYTFFWRGGSLCARAGNAPSGRPASVYSQVADDPDVLRTKTGREAGEHLHLIRDPASGDVVMMRRARNRFTRHQETFDGYPPSIAPAE